MLKIQEKLNFCHITSQRIRTNSRCICLKVHQHSALAGALACMLKKTLCWWLTALILLMFNILEMRLNEKIQDKIITNTNWNSGNIVKGKKPFFLFFAQIYSDPNVRLTSHI